MFIQVLHSMGYSGLYIPDPRRNPWILSVKEECRSQVMNTCMSEWKDDLMNGWVNEWIS